MSIRTGMMTPMWAGNWWPLILGAVIGVGLGGYFLGRHQEANANAAAILKETRRVQALEADLRRKTLEIDTNDSVARTALDQRLIVNLSSPQPIRLCEPAPAPAPGPAATSGSDGTRDDGHVLQVGPDIAAPLHVYGRDCERIRQKLTALQAWARTVQP